MNCIALHIPVSWSLAHGQTSIEDTMSGSSAQPLLGMSQCFAQLPFVDVCRHRNVFWSWEWHGPLANIFLDSLLLDWLSILGVNANVFERDVWGFQILCQWQISFMSIALPEALVAAKNGARRLCLRGDMKLFILKAFVASEFALYVLIMGNLIRRWILWGPILKWNKQGNIFIGKISECPALKEVPDINPEDGYRFCQKAIFLITWQTVVILWWRACA